MLLCTVEGYIHSCWPRSVAARSSCTIGVPASAVMQPSATSVMARALLVSSTRPPKRGRPWP